MKRDWQFILIFLLGAMFASITSDPISDTSYFYANSQGVLTPMQELWYWYYLPFLAYAAIFTTALIMKHYNTISPQGFTMALIFLTAAGTILSLRILGFQPATIILVTVPFILFTYILAQGVHIHTR